MYQKSNEEKEAVSFCNDLYIESYRLNWGKSAVI